MQWLANISIRYPVFAWVLILVTSAFGLIGYSKLNVDRFPKIDIPTVQITTRFNGAAPEEVESEVTNKLEEAIGTVAGIDNLISTSSDGVSLIFARFILEKNGDIATQEIRDRVASVVPDLPLGCDAPVVIKADPDATPILSIALRAPHQSVREITEVADKIVRPVLESVQGVGQVSLVGGRKRQINVWLDPVKLRAVAVTPTDVERALRTQNRTAPGGLMEAGPERLTLRVQGRVESVAQLNRIVVRQAGEHLVRLEDVARVEEGAKDEDTVARLNDDATVLLSVRKQSGENTVATVDAIDARLQDVRKQLPSGYALEIVRDNTQATRTSINAVKDHLLVGALLAALVVLLFLGSARSTLISALAIPASIVGAFGLMWAMGLMLDTLTLLALALSVGIVIDDAIVVIESIVVHIHERGLKPIPAAFAAVKDVGLPVLATTLSLIAVFLPIAFMNSIAGRFFRSFGLTMAISIAISLVVSFSLTPMLGARWLKPRAEVRLRRPLLERLVDTAYRPTERLYTRMVAWILRHRWVLVVASIATVGACGPIARRVPQGFLPLSDDAEFEVNLRFPEGTSIAATEDAAQRVARSIRGLQEVRSTLMTVGDNAQRTPNLANIYVRLVDPTQRKATQLELMARIRKEIISTLDPGIRANISDIALFSGGGFSNAKIQYVLRGQDLDKLARYTKDILGRLRESPAAVDVDSSLVIGNPELHTLIDRDRAADRGVAPADIMSTLRLLVGGQDVSDFEQGGHQYDIHARAEHRYRVDPGTLSLVSVPSSTGQPVALSDLVSFSRVNGPSEITHIDRHRAVTLYSNVAIGFGESDVTAALVKSVDHEQLAAGYSAEPSALSREQARTGAQFGIALGLSIVFMYLVLAAQFGSWLDPVIILLALPLTVPFAMIALLMFGLQFDMYAMLGLLVLFGVVKKNGILQVDHTNQLRRRGMARTEAAVEGARSRLRPILMTTLAFVAGMLPLVFSSGVGAGFNRSTAGIVVGGQSLSLLLTLFATPVIYTLFDDARAWTRRLLRRWFGPVDRGESELEDAAPASAAVLSRPTARPVTDHDSLVETHLRIIP